LYTFTLRVKLSRIYVYALLSVCMVTCVLSYTNHICAGMYAKVAFLECDLGQTEFTVPSVVSLHTLSSPVFGPSYTHQQFPEK